MALASRFVVCLVALLFPPSARCLMRPEKEALHLQETGKGRQVHKEGATPCTAYDPGLHLIQLPAVQRQFLLAVPEHVAPGNGGAPLVFAFHGFSDSPWYSNSMMGLSKKLARYGWLGILPFALDEAGSNGLGGVEACCPTGCDGQCCMEGRHLRQKDATACGWRDNARDLEFVRSLLQWAQLNTCADMGKVFATGFSNGGMFTNYLACHASDLFRAFAPISGDLVEATCEPKRPISYISMCGSNDDEAFCQPTFVQTAASWSQRSKCQGAGLEGARIFNFSATTSCLTWDTCEAQNFVEVCTTEGLGHDASGHLRPDGTSYLRPGSDLDIVGYALQKFSLLVDGSILFWGHPTADELSYKESVWPPPTHSDFMYIRNGSLNTA